MVYPFKTKYFNERIFQNQIDRVHRNFRGGGCSAYVWAMDFTDPRRSKVKYTSDFT